MIYLDWAATAKPEEDLILEATRESFEYFANPSAVYACGLAAKERKEKARENIATSLGARNDEIFFTSGATESMQVILTSLINHPFKNEIIVSERSHPSTLEMARAMKAVGFEVVTIACDAEGFVKASDVEKAMTDKTALVLLPFVDGETGAIQELTETAAKIKQHKVQGASPHFHLDAVQALGKIPINLNSLPIDSATFSAHKIGAMRGCGILYVKNEAMQNITPFLLGGGQERGVRGGTENLQGIISFEKVLQKVIPCLDEQRKNARELMTHLLEGLSTIECLHILPSIRETSPCDDRFSPFIMSFYNHHLRGEVLVRMMSDLQICVSSGSACSSNARKKHTLSLAPSKYRDNVVRISLGADNTKEEIESVIRALKDIMGAVVWK